MLASIRRAWVTSAIVLAVLALVVLVHLVTSWPRPFEVLVEEVLLRSAKPVPWAPAPPLTEVIGCYRLEFADCVFSDADGCLSEVPPEIELTASAKAQGEIDVFRVRAAGFSYPGLSAWRFTHEGTLRVGLSHGFSGVVLELGTDLRGIEAGSAPARGWQRTGGR